MLFCTILVWATVASAGVSAGRKPDHGRGKRPGSLGGGPRHARNAVAPNPPFAAGRTHKPNKNFPPASPGAWPKITARAAGYWDDLTAGLSQKSHEAVENAKARQSANIHRNREAAAQLHRASKKRPRDDAEGEGDDRSFDGHEHDRFFDGDDDAYVEAVQKPASRDAAEHDEHSGEIAARDPSSKGKLKQPTNSKPHKKPKLHAREPPRPYNLAGAAPPRPAQAPAAGTAAPKPAPATPVTGFPNRHNHGPGIHRGHAAGGKPARPNPGHT